MSDAGLAALIFFLLLVAVSMWSLYQHIQMSNLKIKVRDYQIYHQKFIANYIDAHRKNRELAHWISNLKALVSQEIFLPKKYTLEKAEGLYKAYSVPLGQPKVEGSKTIEEVLQIDSERSKYYADTIND